MSLGARFLRGGCFRWQVAFLLGLLSVCWLAHVARAQGTTSASKPSPLAQFVDDADKAGLTMMTVFGGKDSKKFIIETTGTGVAIFDYDNDGWPDIFLVNGTTLEGFPAGKGPTNHLYRNNHDGTFSDVTKQAGLADLSGWGQGACVGDYDNDGWPDIYIACDSTASILFRNNHDGTFTDVAVSAGAAYNEDGREQAGMGVSVGDFNGDGNLDIFKTNFSDDTSTLYRNNGNSTFDDVTFAAGLGLHTQYLGWGTTFFDFDNDGWPDLLVVNGHVYPEVDKQHLGSTYPEPRILYHNNGNGTFSDISVEAGPGITAMHAGRGLAVGDLWNDGRLSAVISNMNDHPSLLVNQVRSANHWIGIRTIGTKSNRDGIGARITVKAGARTLVDEVRSGASYASNNDMRVHFGLGASVKIDWVQIRWPSGLTERFDDLGVDKIHTIKEGSGKSAEAEARPSGGTRSQ